MSGFLKQVHSLNERLINTSVEFLNFIGNCIHEQTNFVASYYYSDSYVLYKYLGKFYILDTEDALSGMN